MAFIIFPFIIILSTFFCWYLTKSLGYTGFVKSHTGYTHIQSIAFWIWSGFHEPISDDVRYKKKNVFVFLYDGLLSSLFIYSNKPLMSTRITSLCRVLNSFVLFIHSRVLLMLPPQGRCPTKNVNAATGSTLLYMIAFLFHSTFSADAILCTVLCLLKRLLHHRFCGYRTSSWICRTPRLWLTPHKTRG